jgi:hypothetical protein
MFSDLRKHPDTANHGALELGGMLLIAGHLSSTHDVRNFIEGTQ